MTTRFEHRLRSLGIELPPMPTSVANYSPFVLSGNLLYISGQGPLSPEGEWQVGKVGENVSVDRAYQHARVVGTRLLAVAQAALGSLDRIQRVVKLLGFVNATPHFTDHPKVIDGCTDLLVEVLGTSGRPARSAIGVGSLPRNMTVEIEAIFEVRPE
jgi:enamine deaminase RidA (YjgF/YER057c/UK114 family)